KPNTEVPLGEPITIDLADKVSDVDNDALQLVNVQVFNGMVVSSFPEDMTNLKFEFSASTPGVYYVAYTVSDHKGGYASNLVQIYVAGPWPDVIVQQTGDVFAAPLSLIEATVGDMAYTDLGVEADMPLGNGDKQVPAFDWATADAICRARGGSLPTEVQITELMTQEGNPFFDDDGSATEMAINWPVARYYFTSTFDASDTNQVKVWDAADGSMLKLVGSGENGTAAYQGYVTCIDKTPMDLKIVKPNLFIQDTPTDFVANFITASGNEFEYTKALSWSVSKPDMDGEFALDATTGQPITEPDGTPTLIVPDFNNNVIIDKSSGVVTAFAEGLLNVSTTDPLGELTDTITIKSTQCFNLAGPCIDIFDNGNGQLFTNSPSVAYLNSIGGGIIADEITNEREGYGPLGSFYRFDQASAHALCSTYNTHNLGGRTNWHLGTYDEMKIDLYNKNGPMYKARGWPTVSLYWTSDKATTSTYWSLYLHKSYVNSEFVSSQPLYVSCVSNP
ncbi:MAG: Ig-like domain-containing protein, partial [Shewanella oncorhynchi]